MRILNSLIWIGLVAAPARAQQVDAYFGMGTAQAKSNGQPLDTADGPAKAPRLTGPFADLGINVFLNRQFGVGWAASWRWSSGDYGDLKYDTTFQTFDAIFQPSALHTRRVAPEIRAGIGFDKVHFQFDNPAPCDQVSGCPDSHFFLAHMAGAARLYFNDHIFVRPALDVCYLRNFHLCGSNWVPRYSFSIGYSFGKE